MKETSKRSETRKDRIWNKRNEKRRDEEESGDEKASVKTAVKKGKKGHITKDGRKHWQEERQKVKDTLLRNVF
jgi:hypothetical protein